MADYTVTIDETLNLFGVEPANLWGTVLWGENWGYGDLDPVASLIMVTDESQGFTTSEGVGFSVLVDEAFNLAAAMYSETVTDPAGYNRFFQVSTNAENRPLTSYNVVSTTSSFTTFTNTSTAWTQL